MKLIALVIKQYDELFEKRGRDCLGLHGRRDGCGRRDG